MMYIDPGSGSMFVQLLLASAMGTIIAFRKRFASLCRRIFRREN